MDWNHAIEELRKFLLIANHKEIRMFYAFLQKNFGTNGGIAIWPEVLSLMVHRNDPAAITDAIANVKELYEQ